MIHYSLSINERIAICIDRKISQKNYKITKQEEAKRFKSWKKLKFPIDIHLNFYANDTSGHDITKVLFPLPSSFHSR